MQFFYIYRTTNLINGKFYVGMHTTTDLNDGYLGSGKLLSLAVKKHGKENFVKEILFFCKSKEELILAEQQVVTDEIVMSGQSYNLALGGQGGDLGVISRMPKSEAHKKKISESKSGVLVSENTRLKMAESTKLRYSRMSADQKKMLFGKSGTENGFFGKHHTADMRNHMSDIAKMRGSYGNPNAKPVTINGKTYPLMKSAMMDLGLNRRQLLKLLGDRKC